MEITTECGELCEYFTRIGQDRLKNNESIRNWTFDMECHTGSFMWCNPDWRLEVYATPFWEGESGLHWQINDNEGREVMIEITTLFVEGRPNSDWTAYLNAVDEMLTCIEDKEIGTRDFSRYERTGLTEAQKDAISEMIMELQNFAESSRHIAENWLNIPGDPFNNDTITKLYPFCKSFDEYPFEIAQWTNEARMALSNMLKEEHK